MLLRHVKAQGFVLLCGGLVGPIFLAVFFALARRAQDCIYQGARQPIARAGNRPQEFDAGAVEAEGRSR